MKKSKYLTKIFYKSFLRKVVHLMMIFSLTRTIRFLSILFDAKND